MNTAVHLRSLKPPQLNDFSKSKWKAYFENTWELYERLFSSIKAEETLYQCPDPLRNPLIFYWGHTAAFYVNKFKTAGLIEEGIDEKFDHLFAVGVDPDLPQNLEVSAYWPSVPEVRAYRKKIYHLVHQVIDKLEEKHFPITFNAPYWALPMTLEHDRIHLETSSMLIRQLEVDLVQMPDDWTYAPTLGNPPKREWFEMPGGTIHIGKPNHSGLFGWDNEYGHLSTLVEPFKATKNLITNAEFLKFVQAGAYENKALWTKEGWDWKKRTHTLQPKFWVKEEQGFKYRAMFDELEMPMDWPVEVNAHEAWAYCQWLGDGSRLLSEAEFELIAREGKPENYDPLFTDEHNLDFVFGSPTPVGYMAGGSTASRFNDIYGNVWDWLKDDFYPLPGFKVHPYYKDFSAPYMDDEHSMLAGGAWASTGTGASRYYRLWFRRHFFQHAGFRLAKNL